MSTNPGTGPGGPMGWALAAVTPFPYRPLLGKLGLFDVPNGLLTATLIQP